MFETAHYDWAHHLFTWIVKGTACNYTFFLSFYLQPKPRNFLTIFFQVPSIPKNDSVWSGGHKEMSSILADQ
jgi:hypothetical protein